jgi:hypothetical protein
MKGLSMSGFSVPGKGDYITLASADKTFEAHVRICSLVCAPDGINRPAKRRRTGPARHIVHAPLGPSPGFPTPLMHYRQNPQAHLFTNAAAIPVTCLATVRTKRRIADQHGQGQPGHLFPGTSTAKKTCMLCCFKQPTLVKIMIKSR